MIDCFDHNLELNMYRCFCNSFLLILFIFWKYFAILSVFIQHPALNVFQEEECLSSQGNHTNEMHASTVEEIQQVSILYQADCP